MKPENYGMKYLGNYDVYEFLNEDLVKRILERSGEMQARKKSCWKSYVPFPIRCHFYSNGIFTIALVCAVDCSPELFYMGVSKKCDTDQLNVRRGKILALVRALKYYFVSERLRMEEEAIDEQTTR